MDEAVWYYRDGNDAQYGLYKHAADENYYFLSDQGWVESSFTLSKKINGWGGGGCEHISEDEARKLAALRGWKFTP